MFHVSILFPFYKNAVLPHGVRTDNRDIFSFKIIEFCIFKFWSNESKTFQNQSDFRKIYTKIIMF